jgi:hypothetical protein
VQHQPAKFLCPPALASLRHIHTAALPQAYKREIELNGAPPKVKYNKFSRQPEPIAKGSDTIYMGNGRVIQDDARRWAAWSATPPALVAQPLPLPLPRPLLASAARTLPCQPRLPCRRLLTAPVPCAYHLAPPSPRCRYPTRNELTGGFAGGELGLTVFKEIGDVPIAEDGQGTKQNSPLVTAFVLGLAATGGGLLLSTIQEVGVSVVEGGVPAANAVNATAGLGLDEKTRATLTAAILLVGVIGTVAGAQVLLDSMANKVRAGASKLAILGAFWVVSQPAQWPSHVLSEVGARSGA